MKLQFSWTEANRRTSYLSPHTFWRVCVMALAAVCCQACGVPGANEAGRAAVLKPGTGTAEIIAEIGQPTTDREVDLSRNPDDPCGTDERNVRAFEYEVPGKGFWGSLLTRLTGSSVASVTTVCLDKDQRVTSTQMTQF